MNRPIGVDLFAGVGGMSLGFEQAGFDVVAAVEIDPIHAAAHAFNFPDAAVIARSVQDLTGQDIRKLANLGDRKVDVVFGGAPCQGFSMIGKRALDDPRNALVRDFVRIVRELDASYFVFENVKGITVGRHRAFLEELIAEFVDAGYAVEKRWKVLNAAQYGVPQNRERLILMGAKKGLPLPRYPEATTRPAGSKTSKLPEGPSCKDALGDLPDAEKFERLMATDSVATSSWSTPSEYATEMRCRTSDSWHYGYVRCWEPNVLTSSARTEHTEISRRRFSNTVPGEVEPISRFFRLPPDGVSNTLRAGTDAARGAFTSPRPIHYKHDRCVTVREMARLHGFPDWFRLHETKWHGARQVGNAVPPPLARAVASSLIAAMDIEAQRPEHSVKLGDPMLVSVSMKDASALFGKTFTPQRRDQKSGARKRKQSEIEEANTLARISHG
ncbi:DNA cytosine methyltransferase [Bosea sp. (in: a-proteobacteria)]|uniref:DNA cytosine methyltransferase n=1 Tax=Bosea sp. (in: a-proteobacteria) TaxID=1871050 RepID=UPI0012282C46|nr:DNA cytosine methyltransferase [Bosea sp. (in: a-proteobacteria)]TAJ31407.1 MAG: DNA cytosine methyltransferase [Bosea sp. (in: a-proteobacteria)]